MVGSFQKLTGLAFLSSVLMLLLFKYPWRLQMKSAGATQDWLVTQHQRKAVLNSTCLKFNLTKPTSSLSFEVGRHLYVEHKHRFIYCQVPKAGCSNWKRIILLLKMNLSIEAGELMNIHDTTLLTNLNYYPPAWRRMLLNNYTKVMFTRHPLQRLISAYRDKFLYSDNEQYYKKTIASVIKTKFRKSQTLLGNVTFPEFVRYILKWKPSHSDIHWRPMFNLCDPCNIQYDILGKFETLQEDAAHVLKSIEAPKGLQFPNVIAYANEARTSARITEEYLKKLTNHELQRLLKIYHLDFTIFNYPIWQNDSLQED